MESVDRTDDRNTCIYDRNHRDTPLGGLWIAEGITNANLDSMAEIICVFTDAFELRDDNERLVERNGEPLQPGNYFTASHGSSGSKGLRGGGTWKIFYCYRRYVSLLVLMNHYSPKIRSMVPTNECLASVRNPTQCSFST